MSNKNLFSNFSLSDIPSVDGTDDLLEITTPTEVNDSIEQVELTEKTPQETEGNVEKDNSNKLNITENQDNSTDEDIEVLETEKKKEEEEELLEIDNTQVEKQGEGIEDDIQVDTPNDSFTQLMKPLAVFLNERGVLPDLKKEDLEGKSHEEILDIIKVNTEDRITSQSKENAENIIEQYVSNLPNDAKFLLENLKEGISFEELLQHNTTTNNLKGVKAEDFEDNEELAKKIIKIDFLDKGFSEEYVEEMLDNIADHAPVAKKSLISINENKEKKIEQSKIQVEERRKAQIKEVEESQKQIKKYIDDTDAFIPGFNLTTKEKNQLHQYLTKPVSKDKQGNPISYAASIREKDPLKFETAITNFLIMTNGLENYDKFVAKAKTNATKEFEKALKNTKSGTGGKKISKSPIVKTDGKTKSNWDKFSANFNK